MAGGHCDPFLLGGLQRGHVKGPWGPRTVSQVAQPNTRTSLSQARPHHQQRGADTTGYPGNHLLRLLRALFSLCLLPPN